MVKSIKKSPKGKSAMSSAISSSGASTPNSQSSTGPLPPFSKAPEYLRPLLEPLSKDDVYLIHIDTTPEDLKQQGFIVPAAINLVITAILAFRAYTGFHVYPAMLGVLIGFTNSMSVDTSSVSSGEIAWTILRRTLTILIDYSLVSLFLSWPIRFIRGPVKWRRAIGFRAREIIVRRSQRSISKNLERNRWIREDEEMRDKIVAAVSPDRLKKTGYLLVDANWDLDYDAMIRAHGLVDRTRKDNGVPLDEFRTSVIVNTDADGWLIWHVGDEDTAEGRARSAQRDQILAFKDKLASMGKEELFFRWVEIIQYESTRPGGFTPERQHAAMLEAKKLFDEEGVDFAHFWREVGGMEGLPDFAL